MQGSTSEQAGQTKANTKMSKAYASIQGERTILKEQEDSLKEIFDSTQRLLKEMREWRGQHKAGVAPQMKEEQSTFDGLRMNKLPQNVEKNEGSIPVSPR